MVVFEKGEPGIENLIARLAVHKLPQLVVTTQTGRIITPEGELSITQAEPLFAYEIWQR